MVHQGIALAALLMTGSLALGSLGTGSPVWAEARAATGPSRDTRSAAYCSRLANIAGFYDTEAALACRREEYTAAARARSLAVPSEIDEYCESLAGEGEAAGPFSWRAYVDCVDSLAP